VGYNALLDRNCKDFVGKKANIDLFQKQGLVSQEGYVLDGRDLDGKGQSKISDSRLQLSKFRFNKI
jgi:hypothetical protein